jgi:hypothetical protein
VYKSESKQIRWEKVPTFFHVIRKKLKSVSSTGDIEPPPVTPIYDKMDQADDYEPGDPRGLTEEERERLIRKKMAELRRRIWNDEIEQEAMRRLLEEERHEQEIRELEERLERDEEQERKEQEAKQRQKEKQERLQAHEEAINAGADPMSMFYQWTIKGKSYYRNAKGHVFEFKEGPMGEEDWIGLWFPETGFQAAPFPANEYVVYVDD